MTRLIFSCVVLSIASVGGTVSKSLGHSQNHLAVAGGCGSYGVPTRYREVVLTVSNEGVL